MEKFEEEFINFFSNVGKNLGMDELPMRVFSIMYMEPDDMTMDDIATKTGYSIPSISNTMKFLEGMRIVHRNKKPGSRKIYFSVERNLAKMNINKLEATNETMVQPTKLYFPEILKHKPKDNKSKEKLKILKDYYDQMIEFEGLLEKWRKDLEELAKKRL